VILNVSGGALVRQYLSLYTHGYNYLEESMEVITIEESMVNMKGNQLYSAVQLIIICHSFIQITLLLYTSQIEALTLLSNFF
jgi:hypothetical protein